MIVLTLSGSVRAVSSNTALLDALAGAAPAGVEVIRCAPIERLPIFNPDREGERTPDAVLEFCGQIERAAGLVVSSPEYVHAIPGGLKNAIDWLVSRQEIIHKPVALAHASHRGDDVLGALRRVLSTVSDGFSEEIFVRFSLTSKTPEEIRLVLAEPDNDARLRGFVSAFCRYIEAREAGDEGGSRTAHRASSSFSTRPSQ